jgi:hypothetical protein
MVSIVNANAYSLCPIIFALLELRLKIKAASKMTLLLAGLCDHTSCVALYVEANAGNIYVFFNISGPPARGLETSRVLMEFYTWVSSLNF